MPSHQAISFKDPCTNFCLSLHLQCLILSKFLSVPIKPSTNRFQGYFSHYLQARALCSQAASFLLRANWRQQGVLEFSKGPSGGLGTANRLLPVIGRQYLPAPLCEGGRPASPAAGFLCMQARVGPLSGEGCWQNALRASPLNLINILIVFPNLVAAHEGDTAR